MADGPPEAKRRKLMDPNDYLGDKLEAEYGRDKPQDIHIDYFYLILAKDYIEKKGELKKHIEDRGGTKWFSIENSQWPQFLVGKYEVPHTTEREREERLYSMIKKTGIIARDKIIIGRACKYTAEVLERSEIDVKQIGEHLSAHYDAKYMYGNSHLDHFYIVVSLPEGQKSQEHSAVEKHLSKFFSERLKGWKHVTPEANWPFTFIGLFPKASPQETEREREWRLHKEVRLPLKKHLMKSAFTKEAYVLFTRACIYND